MIAEPFMAIDWGTTNRRLFLIDESGAVTHTERDSCGVLAMRGRDYGAEIAALRSTFGAMPVLCAGMVGSNIGWRSTAYVTTSAGLEDLADMTEAVADAVWIVPGVSHVDGDRADVMRGEEVQFLGAAAAGLAPVNDALLCQPGTHCKWARIQDGAIASFVTAMTGEIFGLIKAHGLLSATLNAPIVDGPAFREGVEAARQCDLLASLFTIRARSLLGFGDADHASYASGLLIGTDVAARMTRTSDATVFILSDPVLGPLYASALRAHGRVVVDIKSHDAFVDGITRIWSRIHGNSIQ